MVELILKASLRYSAKTGEGDRRPATPANFLSDEVRSNDLETNHLQNIILNALKQLEPALPSQVKSQCPCSIATVQRHLKILLERGLVAKVGTGSTKATRYALRKPEELT